MQDPQPVRSLGAVPNGDCVNASATASAATRLRRHIQALLVTRPALRTETLTLLLSLWFTVACNSLFWSAALDDRTLLNAGSVAYAVALAILLTGVHFIVLTLFVSVLPRAFVRPALALVAISTGLAAYYMRKFHVYLDPEMMRNVLNTDLREASELLSWSMIPAVSIWVLPPLLVILRSTQRPRAAGRALIGAIGLRLGSLVLAAAAVALAALASYQTLSAFLRNHTAARYLITPANLIYGLARNAYGSSSASASKARIPVGLDASLPEARKADRPVLLVVVVGETARAANWGLSGYTRPTTPRLAALDVINFADVTACGTSTEVSLPCMLSPYGRDDYDESLIRRSESLPHVFAHAGLRTIWLDNQSGCKGTCDGLDFWKPAPDDCSGEVCLDEVLLEGARRLTAGRPENSALFLHMRGNHGPAYYRRYPPQFATFQPACQNADLAQCTRTEIVNAYDNALVYTDQMLAETIGWLKQLEATYDTALVYVSDHGESLGEHGLYLHGVPYAIAPDVQKKVPMLIWLSERFARRFALDTECLRARAAQPATHDHLFHTVLGLLDLRTSAKKPELDLAGACRLDRS
ncbi:hypothetical protein B4966_05995 [Rhodocyclaceae bacterium]|nr:hypothetical protein B4966_05995 [Rhodocyclaceae bacterium]